VAVVRYFGGIKLGTGGMARAYADAAKAVVQAADVVAFILRRRYRFKTGYDAVRQTEYRLQQLYGIEVVQRDFVADGVIWQVRLSEEEKNKLQGRYALQEVED
jgi:putative IMPACT (imprinted ancient) family translation regulator